MMQDLNASLFAFVNATADPPALLVGLARFLANWMVFVVAGAMLWGWLRGGAEIRSRLFTTGLTVIVALLVNIAISAAWDHPRPFALGIGHQFLPHAPDSSFPSDHATVLFAVAFGLIWARASVFWSGLAMVVAMSVAWSRVYLGVHWPLDMAGSFVVAMVSAWGSDAFGRLRFTQAIRDGILKSYDWGLDTFRVPGSLSPRAFKRDVSE